MGLSLGPLVSMREWLDDTGPRLMGLICFLTVLNSLLLVGLYFRIDSAPTHAEEPEQAQVTGEAPVASASPDPPRQNERVPLSTANLSDFFTKIMEPFGSDTNTQGLQLPTPEQIQDAIQSEDFNSPEAQTAYQLIVAAYAQSNRPLPPIE